MSEHRPLRFVHLQKPGQKYELEEHKAMRKHVRRAVVREKKSRDIDQNIRIFTPSSWSARKSRNRTKPSVPNEAKSPRSIGQAQAESRSPQAFEELCIERSILPRAAYQDDFPEESLELAWKSDVVGSTLLMNPIFHHPFTVSAAKLVDLPECRIDQLFKSDVFKVVGEPLFDTGQIDNNRNIDLVFPSSLSDPVFMHALVYSMLRIQHQLQPSVEALTFERTTIQLLNHAIANSGDQLSVPVLGAIMLSTANAWRTGNVAVHRAHSSGLSEALRLASKVPGRSPLSPEASRAVFWLDLLANMSMGSQRRVSHLTLPSQPQWRRSKLPADLLAASQLPVGFRRHRRDIPDDLLDCLEDIVELQSAMTNPIYRRDYLVVDDMQASIESRLSFQARACRRFGEISEIVRLTAFICCYYCWTDTWNSNFLPARIANELAGLLETSIATGREGLVEVWSNRIEILLWVLFVGAVVSENEKKCSPGLSQRHANLMRRIGGEISSSEDASLALSQSVKTTLEQFLYGEDWIEKRARMREWYAFEIQVDAKFTCQNGARTFTEVDTATKLS